MATLGPPQDRAPGFRHDPATSGRYLRWWSGTEWGDATRPVGGPTLADVAAGTPRLPAGDGAFLAPISRRAVTAVLVGLVLAVLGARLVIVAEHAFADPRRLVAGWIVLGLAALVAQAGLVGFVVGGVARMRDVETTADRQPPTDGAPPPAFE